MRKCKECEKLWSTKNFKDFFFCTYCDDLYCNKCHCQKECLKDLGIDATWDSSLGKHENLVLYIARLQTVHNRMMNKVIVLLEEIAENTL